ncbi:MAG: hypothetical protein M1438_15540 [Deltaproteobacteria bacterium]|nr:hypothetical protein [Deltaproteobacteria bacterium]
MFKGSGVARIVILVAAIMVLSAPAQAAMWVGAEVGGNFIGNVDVNFGAVKLKNVRVDPTVIGGLTVGYDFVNSGFGGRNYPDWMKYFHVVADFTYNRLTIAGQSVTANIVGAAPLSIRTSRLDGYLAALAFGVLGHYPFFNGMVNPYVGVGPAILWSDLDSGNLNQGNASSTSLAFFTEAGIRWVALQNVTIDTSYRFRWARPTYEFNGTGLGYQAYSHSFLVRVNYHF